MNTSTDRQERATLSAELQTDAAPMLLFDGCRNSTAALNSLHNSIRSKVEVNFADNSRLCELRIDYLIEDG